MVKHKHSWLFSILYFLRITFPLIFLQFSKTVYIVIYSLYSYNFTTVYFHYIYLILKYSLLPILYHITFQIY